MEKLLSTKVSCCFVVFFFTPSSAPPTNVSIPTQTLIYGNLERVFGLYRGNRFTLSCVHINVCWLGTHSTHGAHGVSSSRKGRMCLDAHGSYHFPVFVVAHFLYSWLTLFLAIETSEQMGGGAGAWYSTNPPPDLEKNSHCICNSREGVHRKW